MKQLNRMITQESNSHLFAQRSTTIKPAGECPAESLEGGFTLIEVIVSFAIVSLTFVLIMQLFAGGLQASKASCDYTRAVVHAKDKMEELSANPEDGSGKFEDGYAWSAEIETYKEPEESSYSLKKIKVIVTWSEARQRERSLELVSLKAVESEDQL